MEMATPELICRYAQSGTSVIAEDPFRISPLIGYMVASMQIS